LEGEGIKIRLGAECVAFEKRGGKVAVQVDAVVAIRLSLARIRFSQSVVCRTPTTSVWKTPGLKSISAVTSRLMINFAPMCPAFMRWVIATDEEPSLIPHTMIMKLSPLIF